MNCESLWQLYPLAREQLVNVKSLNGKKLKGTECRVLEVLIANQGQVVPKKELFTQVWGDRIVSDNSLTQCIAQLRLALGDNGKEQKYIKTIPSRGYMLFENVVQLAEPEQQKLPEVAVCAPEKATVAATSRDAEEHHYHQQLKALLALFFAVVFLFQTAQAVNRWTFGWNVPLDRWITETQDERTFMFLDNPASKTLYHYFRDESAHLEGTPVTDLLISTGVSNYYLSCVYRCKSTGDQEVRNFTFDLQENFYLMGGMVRDVCQ
ncbi:winged helix-turn-helix domain-containing protein (plasmid) [Vibrio tubiashii]|uniref:winged helix-turn-helix domain-containing protein n=1 Tax=Vibrio oreintalis group TaxID=1891919 RepID=UPI001EFC9DEC|nr:MULTISPECIES: winged helix-turn-helix domain-containing protein [Vibrio oreintalis group]MCG9753544.1 winged helix-turn-helix domain-containing protein [Vibrio brasiliensis]WCP70355.1 winged helix-turn-helix domain-containing protein [Vibrio tubiashii]